MPRSTVFFLLLLHILPFAHSTSYSNQKYAIRKLYSEPTCSGSAAVAHALELNTCFPNIDDSPISLKYTIVGEHFIISTWINNNECSGKPSQQQKSSITTKCQETPTYAHVKHPIFSSSHHFTMTTGTYSTFVFTESIPAAELGYPYLQTNYTAATVCNTSQFNTPILFHQDATSCLKAATLSYPQAQSIKITKGSKTGGIATIAFGVEYYGTDDCGKQISTYQCPAHCTTDHKIIPTSTSCMTVDKLVADNSGMIVVAILCVIGIAGLGYAVFVYMRKRAEHDPSSFGQWLPSKTETTESNSYSTFTA